MAKVNRFLSFTAGEYGLEVRVTDCTGRPVEPQPYQVHVPLPDQDEPQEDTPEGHLVRKVRIMERALQDIAENGVRADLHPTRLLNSNKVDLDAWWSDYLGKVDRGVRHRANAALSEVAALDDPETEDAIFGGER